LVSLQAILIYISSGAILPGKENVVKQYCFVVKDCGAAVSDISMSLIGGGTQ
jgi:hypothetical protein